MEEALDLSSDRLLDDDDYEPSLYSVSEPVMHSQEDSDLIRGSGWVGGWVRFMVLKYPSVIKCYLTYSKTSGSSSIVPK